MQQLTTIKQVFAQVLVSIFGLLKNKLYIIFLGLETYGLYGLLSTISSPFIAFFGNTSDLLLQRKLSKNKSSQLENFIGIELIFSISIGIIQSIVFLGLLLSSEINNYFLVISLVIFSISKYLHISTLAKIKGLSAHKSVRNSILAGEFLSLSSQCILLILLKENAIIYVIVLNGIAPMLCSFLYLRKEKKYQFKLKLDYKFIKKYMLIGSYKSLSTFFILSSQAIIIYYIYIFIDPVIAGIYFALNGLSVQLYNIILSSISATLFQQQLLAFKKDIQDFRSLINSQSSFCLDLAFLVAINAIILSKLIIIILLDKAMVQYNDLFHILLIAGFANVSKQIHDISLQCHNKKFLFFYTALIGSISILIFSSLGIFVWGGVYGLGYGIFINSIFCIAMIYFFYNLNYHHWPSRKYFLKKLFYFFILITAAFFNDNSVVTIAVLLLFNILIISSLYKSRNDHFNLSSN